MAQKLGPYHPHLRLPRRRPPRIYTTNVIESLNYSLKKPLKTRGAFPSEDALRKVLYLAIMQASKKWTMPVRDWRKALNWFAQLFGARLLDKLGTQNS